MPKSGFGRLLVPILLAAALVTAACGDDDDSGAQAAPDANEAVAVDPGPADTATGTETSPSPDAATADPAAPTAAAPAAAPATPAAPTPAAGTSGAKAAASGAKDPATASAKPAAGGPAPAAGASAAPAGQAPASPSAGGSVAPSPAQPAAPTGEANFDSDVGVTAEAIKLGHLGILSGPVQSVGDDLSYAAQATLKAINDAGGINGRKLDVKVRDDGWDGTKGMAAAKDLIEREKIFGFCCTQTNVTNDLLSRYLDTVQIPMVGSDGFVSEQYGHEWVWPMGSTGEMDGYFLAEYAIKELGAKTAGAFYFDQAMGHRFYDVFKRRFEELGGKMVVNQAGSFDDPGASTFVARARAANPDVIGFSGEPGLWVKLIREAATQGYKPTKAWMGAATLVFDEIPGLAGPWAEGTISTQHWTPNDVGLAAGAKDPGWTKYAQTLTKYYPNIHHANWTKVSYMGANFMAENLKKLGANVTRQRLKDEIDKVTEYDLGLGAKLKWLGNRSANRTHYLLKLVKDPDAPKESGGMRFKFTAGPFQEPEGHDYLKPLGKRR